MNQGLRMARSLIHCYPFACHFFGEMWVVDRWSSGKYTPMILAEENCVCFFQKHNFDKSVQLFDIYCRFFSGLHLAVGRHQRRRFLDILMVSNSAELTSLLLIICILAPESTTNPFFRHSC